MEDKRKKLVFAICEFLQKSIKDEVVKVEDHEGLEVAIQCIGEAFGVDINDPSQTSLYSVRPTGLPAIFDVFLATQAKKNSIKSSSPPQATTNPNIQTTPTSPLQTPDNQKQPNLSKMAITKEQKIKAEELKSAGNKAMTEKKFTEAIANYSSAIAIDGNNAVYYANRAAAYSQNNEHEKAVEDSKRAVQFDSEYSKAYSRMGHAYFSLGNFQEAVYAYEQGVRLDPANTTMKQSLAASQSKLAELNVANNDAPGGGGIAGLGGLSGAGGLDLASLMSNPQFMQMASSMMSNPALASMMQNPNIAQMAQSVMRDPQALSSMIGDPNIARLASQFTTQPGSSPNTEAEEP